MLLIIIKREMHQFNVLMHSIIIPHFRLSGCIDLAFLYLFERVIIRKEMIIFIIKSVLLKL